MEELIKDASSHFPELDELVTRMIAIGVETWVGQDVTMDLPYPSNVLTKIKEHLAFAGWTCTVHKGPSYVLQFDALRSCYPRLLKGDSRADLRLRILELDVVLHFIGMVNREIQAFKDPKVHSVTMDIEGRWWHLDVVKKEGRKASLEGGKVVISSGFTEEPTTIMEMRPSRRYGKKRPKSQENTLRSMEGGTSAIKTERLG